MNPHPEAPTPQPESPTWPSWWKCHSLFCDVIGNAYKAGENDQMARYQAGMKAVHKMLTSAHESILAPNKPTCNCIDCGGAEPAHSPECDYMKELTSEPPNKPAEEPYPLGHRRLKCCTCRTTEVALDTLDLGKKRFCKICGKVTEWVRDNSAPAPEPWTPRFKVGDCVAWKIQPWVPHIIDEEVERDGGRVGVYRQDKPSHQKHLNTSYI